MKKHLITATLLLLLSLKPLFAGVAKGVDVREVQTFLTKLCFNAGPIDGVWGKKTEKAAKEFLASRSKEYSGTFEKKHAATLWAVLNNKENEAFFNPSKKSELCEVGQPKRPIKTQTIAEKIKNRKSINPFTVWTVNQNKLDYGLIWNSGPKQFRDRINLVSLDWNYSAVGTSWGHYPGVDKYLLDKAWGQGADIYGKKLVTNYVDHDFQDFIVNVAVNLNKKYNSDGVFLDWWHDDHQPTVSFSKEQVRNARINLVKKLKFSLGNEKIILANVNWRFDKETVGYLNGINLELGKAPYPGGEGRLYTPSEIKKIEQLLTFYEKNLRPPKLIAPIFMRKTTSMTDVDRNSKENRRMAKLLTAMVTVTTSNGYILYADNTLDSTIEDYAHIKYDFFEFDVGKPTGGFEKLANGVGIKQHQKGFIAYNRNSRPHTLKLDNNVNLVIEGTSGLFCKKKSSGYDCLPPD